MARYIDIEGAGIGKANREQFLVPEFADGWNAVLKILEKEPTADVEEVKHGEWIPVTERLPKGRREYLCVCVFGESEMQFFNVLMFHPEENAENGYVTGPHFSNEGMNDMRVTHWMQLPKPPCGAKMDGGRKNDGEG